MWHWPDDQKARLGLTQEGWGGGAGSCVRRGYWVSLSAPHPLVLILSHQVLGLSFHYL